MSCVYIIDEEYYFANNIASICRIAGFDVQIFGDATAAFEFFSGLERIAPDSRLLVDCALAPGGNRFLFSSEETDDYMKTGIVLLKRIAEKRPDLKQGPRVTLYTAHYTKHLWRQITVFCTENGFGHWQKRPDAEPQDIVALVT